MDGWGKSGTWPTIAEAVEAARRSQNWPATHGGEVRPIAICRTSARAKGRYRHGGGVISEDIVAWVLVDGSVKYGRSK